MKLNRQTLRKMILKEMVQKINGDYRAGVFMSPDYRTAAENAVRDPFMMDPEHPMYEPSRKLRYCLQQLSHFVHNRPDIYNNEYFMQEVPSHISESLVILDNYPGVVKMPTDVISLKIYLNHISTLVPNLPNQPY